MFFSHIFNRIFMKKSTITRPVSPKSYARFVERINLVIADEAKRLSMLSALDRYLSGDRATYAEGLTPDCALAFEMLRYDIDLAIIRSMRARMRARTRKNESEKNVATSETAPNVTTLETQPVTPGEGESTDSDAQQPLIVPPSRRQRRALLHSLRTKSRWRKL